MRQILERLDGWLAAVRRLDFIAPLALRLYLVPVFWMAGTNKLSGMAGTIQWFEHSLGLPLPTLMAWLAALTETIGAVLLLLGLALPVITIPLMVTMLVAIFAVHWENGWAAVASSSNPEVSERLEAARSILQEHGQYDWLTAKGSFVILNNGVEFAVTYLIMLVTLFFIGGGRYVSADFYLRRWLQQTIR
jgi:uncharacterized membrane protein YphA (DoxX/SURF4 family)